MTIIIIIICSIIIASVIAQQIADAQAEELVVQHVVLLQQYLNIQTEITQLREEVKQLNK